MERIYGPRIHSVVQNWPARKKVYTPLIQTKYYKLPGFNFKDNFKTMKLQKHEPNQSFLL